MMRAWLAVFLVAVFGRMTEGRETSIVIVLIIAALAFGVALAVEGLFRCIAWVWARYRA
jgi:hypothetical protein